MPTQTERNKHLFPEDKDPEETWVISGHTFHIFEQRTDEYAVRIHPPEGGYFWLKTPELHYETTSGCRYAIMLFLESLEL